MPAAPAVNDLNRRRPEILTLPSCPPVCCTLALTGSFGIWDLAENPAQWSHDGGRRHARQEAAARCGLRSHHRSRHGSRHDRPNRRTGSWLAKVLAVPRRSSPRATGILPTHRGRRQRLGENPAPIRAPTTQPETPRSQPGRDVSWANAADPDL